MKVGDSVVCIKEYNNKFFIGKRYEINNIFKSFTSDQLICVVYTSAASAANSINMSLIDDVGLFGVTVFEGAVFEGAVFEGAAFQLLFSDYFIGIREYRKLKLEKINEIR